MNFYSKLVRLEVTSLVEKHTNADLFLFQIGAIRSIGHIDLLVLDVEFLFQIGAIRSLT